MFEPGDQVTVKSYDYLTYACLVISQDDLARTVTVCVRLRSESRGLLVEVSERAVSLTEAEVQVRDYRAKHVRLEGMHDAVSRKRQAELPKPTVALDPPGPHVMRVSYPARKAS
jgi:hypothetical protein